MKALNLFFVLLFSTIVSSVFSQKESNINLIVKDSKNNPISNALILFDDIKQTQKTNSKGIFAIKKVKKPKKITAFSPFHGIRTIKYDGKKYNRIIIFENKSKISIATPSNVITKENKNAFKYKNIYEYLQGEVSGVSVTSGNKIAIRGFNTINGSTTPLFILNKSEISQGLFENIPLAQIKKTKILKGPETSIYGIRGANGVIEVTTY